MCLMCLLFHYNYDWWLVEGVYINIYISISLIGYRCICVRFVHTQTEKAKEVFFREQLTSNIRHPDNTITHQSYPSDLFPFSRDSLPTRAILPPIPHPFSLPFSHPPRPLPFLPRLPSHSYNPPTRRVSWAEAQTMRKRKDSRRSWPSSRSKCRNRSPFTSLLTNFDKYVPR